MNIEPLLNFCIVFWLLGLAAATALGLGRQYLGGSEGLVHQIVLWPVRAISHLLRQAWREVGRQLWRVVVRAAAALWERIRRW